MSKWNAAAVAVMCCSGLFLNSCMYEVPVYGGVSYSNGYNGVSVAAWTDASYDANGFPIYGYYYGRPVYGYTPEGVAIFTFAALTAACFVPYWAPAPWYHGHWHYPHHIHRAHVPHHCPHDHHPSRRPHGGLDAPIHKNPQSVLRPQHHNAAPQKHHNAPQAGRTDFHDKGAGKRDNSRLPGVGRLEHQRRQGSDLPVFNPQQHKGNNRHESRPNAGASVPSGGQVVSPNRASQHHHGGHANRAPQMGAAAPSAPQVSRPSAPQVSRPSAPSVPSASPSHGSRGFGGHNGGFSNHGGGHGGHRR